MATSTGFRVSIPGQVAADDILGVWQAEPGDGPATVWSVDVAAGETQAGLQGAARRVNVATRAIPAGEQRLMQFLREQRARRTPEQHLASALAAPGVTSFAPGEELEPTLAEAVAFAGQVRRSLGQPALVTSSIEGQPLGRTRVSWSGDVQTVWGNDLSPADAALHREVVEIALSTVQSWMRIVMLVGTGAVHLSLMLPSGVGAIVALPAVWRFTTALLTEYGQLREDT